MATKHNILITGAAGFVGSHLARKCVREGYDVSVLLKQTSDTSKIKDIFPEIRCIYGNLIDMSGLQKVMEKVKPKGVFHLAASTVMSGKTSSPDEVIKSNILGTVNLINASRNLDLDFFINTGTFLEYSPQNRAVSEVDPCDPSELYSITKLANTLYAKSASRLYNIPILTLRVFTPYGPFLQGGRLVYETISRSLQNKEITLTNATVTRDFIFVEDLADLYLAVSIDAKKYAGQIFNAGSGIAISLKEFSEKIISMTDSESKVSWGNLPAVVYDSSLWQADMNKTFSSFPWRPKNDFTSGLIKTIDWFKKGGN